MIQKIKNSFDFILFFSLVPLVTGGLFVLNAFGEKAGSFDRQVIWLCVSLVLFFVFSTVDFRFLRKTWVVVGVYSFCLLLLVLILFVGSTVKGAQSWFHLGFFSFQPADLSKLAVILMLSKYFSKRHVEIANIRHILVSGAYAFLVFGLTMLQPDLGSGMIVFMIWFGMILVSGVSKKHVAAVLMLGIVTFSMLWLFGFKDYQKKRIMTFLNPLADVRGAGYNANQSIIAVGSGELFGKGIGYGTQSRLNFLPEYQTDFVFAAFAEEWGFFGVTLFLLSFTLLIVRILQNAYKGETNFEILYGVGIAIWFIAHFTINVGMNMGLMPVTGIPLPFVSYGGSNLLISFAAIGILMGMRRYARAAHRDVMKNEFLGV